MGWDGMTTACADVVACLLAAVLQAEIEVCVEMYTAEKEDQLLGGNPDFVLDAIDNIDTKVGRQTGRQAGKQAVSTMHYTS